MFTTEQSRSEREEINLESRKHIQRSASANKPAVQPLHSLKIIQRIRANPNSLTPQDVIQLQRTIGNQAVVQLLSTIKGNAGDPLRKEGEGYKSCLPTNLKMGIQNLSGMSMDDVTVNYNSTNPSKVQALAYTQSTDIHLAPGQEKYLPHEAWHVVQQKQERVKPTIHTKNIAINNDAVLEREADVMGRRASEYNEYSMNPNRQNLNKTLPRGSVLQKAVDIESCESDTPKTIVTALKDAGIAKTYLGALSNPKVDYPYERPKKIQALISNDPMATDDYSKASQYFANGVDEIGHLGKLEAIVFKYATREDIFHGGHIVGECFWDDPSKSRLEANLIPMLLKINNSLYKIFENEVRTYLVSNPNSNVRVKIGLNYADKKEIKLNDLNCGLYGFLTGNRVNMGAMDLNKTIKVMPRVPYQITVELFTLIGEPDLEKRIFNTQTDIFKADTYNTLGYYEGVSWDATHSKKTATKTIGSWMPFEPVKLKAAGTRTYNFYQQTD